MVAVALPQIRKPARCGAFSSEVDTGSHSNQVYADCVDLSAVENASKQQSNDWTFVPFDMSPRPLLWFATPLRKQDSGERHAVDAQAGDCGIRRRTGLARHLSRAGPGGRSQPHHQDYRDLTNRAN